MLGKNLEKSLNKIFLFANDMRHESLTVEHLLRMLTDNSEAKYVLTACGADVAKLNADVNDFIDESVPLLEAGDDRDSQPTLGFQRVLQRALFRIQESNEEEVSGVDVLEALYSEQDSTAVEILQRHNVNRQDVANFLSSGIPGNFDADGPSSEILEWGIELHAHKNKIRELTREIAILKKKVAELEKCGRKPS